MDIDSIEPELRAFEKTFGCRLCLHFFTDLFFRGREPLLDLDRQSHRKTHPDRCGREQRSYCIRHCMESLNRRIAETPERDLFAVHCRNGCFELAAPVFREGKCVLILFAGLLDPREKEKVRRLARLLPVFASGLEAKVRFLMMDRSAARNSWVERVEDFIEKHYRDAVSTADAAKALSLSVSRLCHILQESGRGSFSKMLMDTRLYHARRLLTFADSDMRISEIAALCGFPGYEHFSRCFKKGLGESPAAWRKKHTL